MRHVAILMVVLVQAMAWADAPPVPLRVVRINDQSFELTATGDVVVKRIVYNRDTTAIYGCWDGRDVIFGREWAPAKMELGDHFVCTAPPRYHKKVLLLRIETDRGVLSFDFTKD